MLGAIPPLPQYAFMAWCLVKHRDNFTFTFTATREILAYRESADLRGRKWREAGEHCVIRSFQILLGRSNYEG
jgi:hypothetical protein